MLSRDKDLLINTQRPIELLRNDLALINESLAGMKRQVTKTEGETLLIQKEHAIIKEKKDKKQDM